MIVLELIGFVYVVLEHHLSIIFVYYTWISNLFMLVCCVLCAFAYYNKSSVFYKICMNLKFVAMVMLAITFLVVITILLPSSINDNWHTMFTGGNLYHHIVCPLLAVLIFLGFDDYEPFALKKVLLPAIPTLIYAIVFVLLNFFRVVDGPYPFLRVHNQPVWVSIFFFVLIISLCLIISLVFVKIKNRLIKGKTRN